MTDVQKKLRVYLDIDGVENVFAPIDRLEKSGNGLWDNWTKDTALGYSITWSPDLINEYRKLEDEGVEFVWLTTWVHNAPDAFAKLIGWGDHLTYLGPTEEDAWMYQNVGSIHWKIGSVKADQARDPMPFVWIDDEIGHFEQSYAGQLGGHAVRTEPNFGVTPRVITMIRGILERTK